MPFTGLVNCFNSISALLIAHLFMHLDSTWHFLAGYQYFKLFKCFHVFMFTALRILIEWKGSVKMFSVKQSLFS